MAIIPINNWQIFYRSAQLHYVSFRILSREFKKLRNTHGGKKFSGYHRIVYYHALRSVELLLKCYLIYKGYTANQVKKEFGHDLLYLILIVEQHGLIFDEKTFFFIKHLNTYYQKKEFEYISLTAFKIVKLEHLTDMLKFMFSVADEKMDIKKTK
jgi:hypothetical protein